MADIILLNIVFPPDGVSTARLLGSVASHLAEAGHSVRVLTTMPHNKPDALDEKAQPITRRWGSLIGRSRLGEVLVTHVWMPQKSPRGSVRFLQWLWFHAISTAMGLAGRRPDIVFATSPPLTMGLNAWAIGRGRAPFIYNVWELYPDIAVRLGLVSSEWVITVFKRMEKWVYRKAAAVTVTSTRTRDLLVEENRISPEKLHVIPNFVDVTEIVPRPKDNPFASRYGLVGKFVVTYAGNMGVPQNLDLLLSAAEHLQPHSSIHFLLVGGGDEQPRLKSAAAGMSNVTVLDNQPYQTVPDIYGASDLCVVPLAGGIAAEAVPSKVFQILAAKRAVVAITETDSALADIVAETRCGVVVTPNDVDGLVARVRHLAQNHEEVQELALSGPTALQGTYDEQSVLARYESLIDDVLKDPKVHTGGKPPELGSI